MIAGMEADKKLRPIFSELFLRAKQPNILLVFISQSYFKMPKTKRLTVTPNKRELQQTISNHSSDNKFEDFAKLYKVYTKEPFSFLVSNTTLLLDTLLRFRSNLL